MAIFASASLILCPKSLIAVVAGSLAGTKVNGVAATCRVASSCLREEETYRGLPTRKATRCRLFFALISATSDSAPAMSRPRSTSTRLYVDVVSRERAVVGDAATCTMTPSVRKTFARDSRVRGFASTSRTILLAQVGGTCGDLPSGELVALFLIMRYTFDAFAASLNERGRYSGSDSTPLFTASNAALTRVSRRVTSF